LDKKLGAPGGTLARIPVTESSGNVFADLGASGPDEDFGGWMLSMIRTSSK
jgi:hypothetical protein